MIYLIIINCFCLLIIVLCILIFRKFEKSEHLDLDKMLNEIKELNSIVQIQKEELESARDPVSIELKKLENLKLKIKEVEIEIIESKNNSE